MQCACAILSSVACRLCDIFPRYLINGAIFRKKRSYWTQNVFLLSLQCLSETCLILRRNERDIIKNVYWFSFTVNYPLFLSFIKMKFEFSRQIFENYESTDIQTWGSQCSPFVKFDKAPKLENCSVQMAKFEVPMEEFMNFQTPWMWRHLVP